MFESDYLFTLYTLMTVEWYYVKYINFMAEVHESKKERRKEGMKEGRK